MTTETTVPYFEDEDSKLKLGVPIVERRTINAVVYYRAKKEVICLDWQEFGWKTFIIGGIEEGGEDPVAAAEREISEETGYKNLRFITDLGRIRSAYYAAHKKENRIAHTTCLLFELVDEEKSKTPPVSNLPHVFKWIPRTEVATFLTLSSQKYIWEQTQPHLQDQ